MSHRRQKTSVPPSPGRNLLLIGALCALLAVSVLLTRKADRVAVEAADTPASVSGTLDGAEAWRRFVLLPMPPEAEPIAPTPGMPLELLRFPDLYFSAVAGRANYETPEARARALRLFRRYRDQLLAQQAAGDRTLGDAVERYNRAIERLERE